MQKNLDEGQLNRSRCIAAPLFQKSEKYIYIYIYIYIYSKKKRRKKKERRKEKKKREKSVLRQVLLVELKVLPVQPARKQAVAKSYR